MLKNNCNCTIIWYYKQLQWIQLKYLIYIKTIRKFLLNLGTSEHSFKSVYEGRGQEDVSTNFVLEDEMQHIWYQTEKVVHYCFIRIWIEKSILVQLHNWVWNLVKKTSVSTLSALGNEGQAQEITAQTRSSQADVIMFSGCKDNQTSADTNVSGYGATGAASYAFINAVRNNQNLTYIQLLNIMRDTLAGKYSQKIQMSTGFPTDMNIPFIF